MVSLLRGVYLSGNIFFARFCVSISSYLANLWDSGVSNKSRGVLWALMASRDCGALIHLMVFLCCRVHRSLGSRSNFRSASPAIVSRRSSTFCRPNTTGILPPFVFTNLSSPIAAKRRRTDFIRYE